jgi:hypothetical protein
VLDAAGGAVEQFAAGLRELRDKAGRPGYRELARRAHYSVTTLSVAAAGRKLPSLEVAMAYVHACGGDITEWELRWRAAAGEPTGAVPDVDARQPYRDDAYGPEDVECFAGRDRVIGELLQALASRRTLAVFGTSGIGLSSVLRAGLLPRVEQGALSGGDGWPIALMTPGDDPLTELTRVVGAALPAVGDEPVGDVGAAVSAALAAGPELLLVVDQFEELFTRCADEARRADFIAAVLGAAHAGRSRLRVVLGIRADQYARCASRPDLAEVVSDAVTLRPMRAAELRQALTQPAERLGVTVDEALISSVVAEVTDRPTALPVAVRALARAWQDRQRNELTLADYEAGGGLAGALAASAEATYTGLTPDQQRTAPRVLLQMLDIGAQTVTPRRVTPADLHQEDAGTATVVERLIAGRILAASRATVELTHESLTRSWPRLGGWVDAWLAQHPQPATGHEGRAAAAPVRRRAILAGVLAGILGLGAVAYTAYDRSQPPHSAGCGPAQSAMPVPGPDDPHWQNTDQTVACATGAAGGWDDGRADLFVHEGTNVAVRFQQAGGFDGGRGITFGFGLFHGRQLPSGLGRLHFADFTGDKRTDMIVHEKDDLLLFLNNGTKLVRGPVISSGWAKFHGRSVAGDVGELHFADFDANGRVDLIVRNGADLFVHLNDGTGFGVGRLVSSGWSRFHGRPVKKKISELHFADIDADGHADLIAHDGTDVSVHLNNGTRFGAGRVVSSGWGLFHGKENTDNLGRLHFADFDGDRRADLFVHEGNSLSVRLNTGGGFDLGRSVSSGWGLFHGKQNKGQLGRVYLG